MFVGVKLIFLRVKALLIVFSVEWLGIKCGLTILVDHFVSIYRTG